MSVTVPARTREQRARDVVSANYELRKEEFIRAVGSRLRADGLTGAVREDLEEAYNQGWHGVCRHIEQGKKVSSLGGLLFTIMLRRAIDICRQKRETPLGELDLDQPGFDPDPAEQIEHQETLRGLLNRLRENLSTKERQAVTLCVIHGYTRPEAAELLGIDRPAFERVMDGATKKIARIVASVQARGCSDGEWSRLMRDYALGLLPEHDRDYLRAKEHTEGSEACAACSRYVHALRGLSAVLPPMVPVGPPSGLAHGFLGFLRGLFGAGQSTTPAATSVIQTAAAGVPMSASQAAAGSGGISLLAGGSVKAVLVLAGVVAASTASLQPTSSHHRPRHPGAHPSSVSAHVTSRSSPWSTVRSGTTARVHIALDAVANAAAVAGSDVRRRDQVAAEFGIERVRSVGTSPRASASALRREPALTSHRQQPSARVASAGEFGLKSAGTSSRSSSRVARSEFGFEGSHG